MITPASAIVRYKDMAYIFRMISKSLISLCFLVREKLVAIYIIVGKCSNNLLRS